MREYIVFDLEWNQSSRGKEEVADQLPFEIFEIGAVKLNDKFEMTGSVLPTDPPTGLHEDALDDPGSDSCGDGRASGKRNGFCGCFERVF